jgi:hypothetical protein
LYTTRRASGLGARGISGGKKRSKRRRRKNEELKIPTFSVRFLLN